MKPDLRLGLGPGLRPMGLGLGQLLPKVNRTPALRFGLPDQGPMGPPLLESGDSHSQETTCPWVGHRTQPWETP